VFRKKFAETKKNSAQNQRQNDPERGKGIASGEIEKEGKSRQSRKEKKRETRIVPGRRKGGGGGEGKALSSTGGGKKINAGGKKEMEKGGTTQKLLTWWSKKKRKILKKEKSIPPERVTEKGQKVVQGLTSTQGKMGFLFRKSAANCRKKKEKKKPIGFAGRKRKGQPRQKKKV